MFLWGSAAALFALPEGTLRGAVLGSLLWRGLTLRLCNMMNVTVSFHSLQHAPILGFTCHALSQRLVFLHAHTHTHTHSHIHTHKHTHTISTLILSFPFLLFIPSSLPLHPSISSSLNIIPCLFLFLSLCVCVCVFTHSTQF